MYTDQDFKKLRNNKKVNCPAKVRHVVKLIDFNVIKM